MTQAEGHADGNGLAFFKLPIYQPQGYQGGPIEYFTVFRHVLAKALRTEDLLRTVTDMAVKAADHALIPGIAFTKGTSFISPKAAAGLKTLERKPKEWEKKYPQGRIDVFGHAEKDEKNAKALSERRARSAFAFITNDAAAWEKPYLTESWGLVALQTLLKGLGHYMGKVDGEDGPNTQAAFKAVQKKAGLPETGKEDAATRKALFDAYMRGKHDIKLEASRFRAVAGNPWMGCAANNRVKDGEASAPENRRVEFLLLNESKLFPISFYCRDGSEKPCEQQCRREGKRSAPGIKCWFYDVLVREEKQTAAADDAPPHNIPWMDFAEKEARRWKGKTEDVISKTINYHKEVGLDLANLSGTEHAWCASFVNYCLKQAGYEMSALPCRARSFSGDSNFVEIDEPTFGSIAMIGTYHVCFVYAKDEKTSKPICLGGNQSDKINFTVFHDKTRYFLPKRFDPGKHITPPLDSTTASDLNARFEILTKTKQGNNTR